MIEVQIFDYGVIDLLERQRMIHNGDYICQFRLTTVMISQDSIPSRFQSLRDVMNYLD